MKRCPKCSRVYTDQTFQFCLDDGADLMVVNDQKTERFEVSTQIVARKAPVKKSRWLAFSLIGGVAAFIVLGLFSATLFFTLRGTSGTATTDRRTNDADNTNTPIISAPLFGADDETELKTLMEKISVAFVNSDTATLDYYLADEYFEEDSNGVKTSKKEIMKPQAVGERVSLIYSDLKVTVKGDKATVTGVGESKFRILGTLLTQRFNFKAQWAKREGRWRGVYSYSDYIE